MRTSVFQLFLAIVLLVLSACSSAVNRNLETRTISIEGQTFTVEVADTMISQAIGLMNRKELPEGRGMLFVWDEPAPRAFWMKNTLIPLDILYFRTDNATGALLLDNWYTAPPCQADPCPSYPSQTAVRHVVELPAGTVKKYGWTKGSRLAIRK